MSERVNENIMILGVTGAGKSSLINYLFGEKILAAGAGMPVTKKGEFQHLVIPSRLKDDVDLHIYDCCGLESDTAEEWKKTIQERLTANYDFANITHSIVYCFPYANDRIQEFETALINAMLESGHRVIIAFTKADSRDYEEKKKIFRGILSDRIKQEYRNLYTTVDVCAAPVKKIGQESAAEPFGRDELLEKIEQCVSASFVRVALGVWDKWKAESLKKVSDKENSLAWEINQFYDLVYDIESAFKRLTTTKTKRAKELVDYMSRELKKLIEPIFTTIQKSCGEMLLLYMKISGSLYPVETGKTRTVAPKVDLSGVSMSDGSFTSEAASFVVKCIPVIGLFQMALEKGFLQDELRGILKTNIGNIKKEINELYVRETALLGER